MIIPEFTHWWQLHNFLLNEKKKIEASNNDKAKIDNILYQSITVKIRIQYSHHFATEILRFRLNDKSGDVIRRNFEAFLFFIRSVLDCLAQLITDLCNLRLDDREVNIIKVKDKLSKYKNLATLYSFLKSEINNASGTWFWHLNKLRNLVTHRSVIPMVQHVYIGMPIPARDDLRFTLENPEDIKSLTDKPEFGLGFYAENKFNKVYEIIEKVCEILHDELNKRNIKTPF